MKAQDNVSVSGATMRKKKRVPDSFINKIKLKVILSLACRMIQRIKARAVREAGEFVEYICVPPIFPLIFT